MTGTSPGRRRRTERPDGVDAVLRDITGNRPVPAQPRKFCPNAFD